MRMPRVNHHYINALGEERTIITTHGCFPPPPCVLFIADGTWRPASLAGGAQSFPVLGCFGWVWAKYDRASVFHLAESRTSTAYDEEETRAELHARMAATDLEDDAVQ